MHSADDENYHRGYEWWLMTEAKKVCNYNYTTPLINYKINFLFIMRVCSYEVAWAVGNKSIYLN